MTTWKIKDLKGVGDVELELDDSKRVFVFLGSNGVGKTKTLEALSLFLLNKNRNFDFNPHILEVASFGLKIHHKLFSEIKFENECVELTKDEGKYSHINYQEFFDAKLDRCFDATVLLSPVNRISLKEKTNSVNSSDRYKKNISESTSQDISFDSFNKIEVGLGIHEWFTERAKSVNPYQKQEDNLKADIDTVLNAINILDNRIEKRLVIDGSGRVFLNIEGQERELSQLSSGFLSVVKIIQSIIASYSAFTNETDLLNVKGVVLIDEIESHLHVDWQTKIIPTLKNLFPNTTFYIATHSPLVLSQLSQGEAYLLKRDDDGVVRSEQINNPNGRLFSSVLNDAFGINLNQLKRKNMEFSDQSEAKKKLLALLNDKRNGEGNFSD